MAECQEEDQDLGAPGGAPDGDAQTREVHVHVLSPVTLLGIYHDRPPFYNACAASVPEKRGGTCNKKAEQAL